MDPFNELPHRQLRKQVLNLIPKTLLPFFLPFGLISSSSSRLHGGMASRSSHAKALSPHQVLSTNCISSMSSSAIRGSFEHRGRRWLARAPLAARHVGLEILPGQHHGRLSRARDPPGLQQDGRRGRARTEHGGRHNRARAPPRMASTAASSATQRAQTVTCTGQHGDSCGLRPPSGIEEQESCRSFDVLKELVSDVEALDWSLSSRSWAKKKKESTYVRRLGYPGGYLLYNINSKLN